MSKELINSIVLENEEVRKKNISIKLLISFFFLIISADTISYLVLQNDTVIGLYQKVLVTIILLSSLFFFFYWKKSDRICFLIFMAFLVKLIIESLVNYRSILAYPSVLAVIFPFLYVYFIKNLFKQLNIDILTTLIAFIFIGYFVFMLFYGHEFDFENSPMPLYDGVGPYSGDTRILHANSILLFVLPFLFFLNKMFSAQKSFLSIAGFAISFIIILIHQHRTVWVVTIFSGMLLLFMKGINRKILTRLFFFVLLMAGIFTVLVLSIPGLSQLLTERFLEVLDPLNEDTTGGFRYLQILSYLNYFIQKPLFGWTFSGFELSNPFISHWEEGTGHHFHDAYIEVLFYFGITGLLLKFYPLYAVAKKAKKRLSDNSKVLAAFSISGFLYSFSYVPPFIFWGIVGLCLYYMERDFRMQQPVNAD